MLLFSFGSFVAFFFLSFLPLSLHVPVLCTDLDQSLCPSFSLLVFFCSSVPLFFLSFLLLLNDFPFLCFSSNLSYIGFLFSHLIFENNSLLKEQEMERDVETCRMLASYFRQV